MGLGIAAVLGPEAKGYQKRYDDVAFVWLTPTGRRRMDKRFRVAFSFAGEKREFIAEVAEILAGRFGREAILYDRYHEAEFSTSDLAFSLPRQYNENVDLVVAVLCPDYVVKEWCRLEWKAIYRLLMQKTSKQVMLSRFAGVIPEGDYGLGGFIELDDITASRFAELILERLALNEEKPRDFYLVNPHLPGTVSPRSSWPNYSTENWPREPPPLSWQMANHRQAQVAFTQLLSGFEPRQLLLIKGNSEMGKTHLSNQFFANALRIQGLRCGRFDFKGAGDLDGELQAFADHLGIESPCPNNISNCLAQILSILKQNPQPTLLIFDTFEAAAEARSWVVKRLLPTLIRTPWLRLVIMGQAPLIHGHGESWEGCCLPPIQLSWPTPEEWFAYGKAHRPDLDLAFVTRAYNYLNGRSSTLAQLLGPSR